MTVSDIIPILGIDEIRAEIARRNNEIHEQDAATAAQRYRHIRTFGEAAEALIEVTQNTEGRLMLGIPELDVLTRGFGRGELIFVTGRAHSGKTQVVLNMINANNAKNVLFFTPDEVAPLVLSKLAAMHYGISAEDIEHRIKANDQSTVDMVRRAANHDFRNLIVIDDSLTLTQCSQALAEAQDWWGGPADLIVFDYLELIPGDLEGGEGVVAKAQALKRWTKGSGAPVVCLHQSSRSSAPRGQSAGMNSGKFGTEQEAIMLLEVYRKRENESLDEWERARHQNTLTCRLVKNKRPPSKVGEVDLFIDPSTGAIRSLRDEDMITVGTPMSSADQALRARSAAGF